MKLDLLPLQAEGNIFLIRRQRVMLDYDLAALYGMEARALNQAVKRNLDRFPQDFMFQLTAAEAEQVRPLVSQAVIPPPPEAAEQAGVPMSLASVIHQRFVAALA
jgi:hypothetical protein